jgi:PDDEXK-like domain of unknown function (DUF3799)
MSDIILDTLELSADEYHKDAIAPEPSLSSSIAKILFTQTPMHARLAHPRLNPQHIEKESSDFDIGGAAHSLLLEGENIIFRVPHDDWRTNAAKGMREEARAAGLLPLLSKHADNVLQMARVAKEALAESELGVTLEDFVPERTIIWRDGKVFKRCRIDLSHKSRPLLLDYKSTTDASPQVFSRLLLNLGYDIQAAHYVDGYREATPACQVDPEFIFLVQERTAPFACSLVGVDPVMLDLGQRKVERATVAWAACMASGKWPGYGNRVQWASPPGWALTQFEESEGVFA